MIEMRQDPTTRIWILVGRGGEAQSEAALSTCPFCRAQEAQTPPSVAVIPGRDGAWRVRAFPDRVPFFQVEGSLDRAGGWVYDRMRNVGAHEIEEESYANPIPPEEAAQQLREVRIA